MLRPLNEWTGDVSHELTALVDGFRAYVSDSSNFLLIFLVLIHSDRSLETRVKNIQSLQDQNTLERVVQASYITEEITTMRNFLNDSIFSFNVCIINQFCTLVSSIAPFLVVDNVNIAYTSYRPFISPGYASIHIHSNSLFMVYQWNYQDSSLSLQIIRM